MNMPQSPLIWFHDRKISSHSHVSRFYFLLSLASLPTHHASNSAHNLPSARRHQNSPTQQFEVICNTKKKTLHCTMAETATPIDPRLTGETQPLAQAVTLPTHTPDDNDGASDREGNVGGEKRRKLNLLKCRQCRDARKKVRHNFKCSSLFVGIPNTIPADGAQS
jgi:hypothetical protein